MGACGEMADCEVEDWWVEKERVFQSGRFKVDLKGREECVWEMHPKHIPRGPSAVIIDLGL